MKRLSIFFAALMACTLSFAQTTFEKVTAAPADWSGEYLLVYENSATEAYVWNGLDKANGYATATIADGKITADGLVTLTITSIDGGYSILLNGGDNDGKYIGYTAAKNGMNISDAAIKNTLAIESNAVAIKSGTAPSTMRFNNASDQMRFRYYKTGQKAVQLYKKRTAEVPATAIALDKTTATLDKGATEQLTATLTPADATTAVVWATENAEIATVDKGLVTAVGVGTTNITATVTPAEGTTYTATCAVTVVAAPDAPVFTVTEATFEGSMEVALSAAEGLAIYYTIDGTEPTTESTLYAAPFAITATTTVKAIAYDATISKASVAAEMTYTKAMTCAEANAAAKNDVINLNTVTVVYANGANIYVADATGTTLVYSYDFKTLQAGQVVKGIKGTMDIYSGLPEVKPTVALADLTITDGGTIPAPALFTAVPTADDVNKYITIKGIKFDKDYTGYKSKTNATALVGETELVVRNNFTIDFGDLMAAYAYDITGFVSIYNGTIQFYPVAINDITMHGNYTIGTAEGCDYASLAAAFTAYNTNAAAGMVLGNVTFQVATDLAEPKNVGIQNPTDFTVTLTVDKAEARTISFSQAGDNNGPSGNICIGCDMTITHTCASVETKNVVLDGSFEGSEENYLTIKSVTGCHKLNGPVLVYGNVKNTTIKNCNLIAENGVGSSLYPVTIRSQRNTDYAPENIVVDGNYIEAVKGTADQGIYFQLTTAGKVKPANVTISNNEIVATTRGIFMKGINGATIKNNTIKVKQTNAGMLSYGIWGMQDTEGEFNIEGNIIAELGTGAAATGSGIYGIVANAGKWYIRNNYVSGFNVLATAADNIALVGIQGSSNADTVVIEHNTVAMAEQTNKVTNASAAKICLIKAVSAKASVKNNLVVSGEAGFANALVSPAGIVENNVYCTKSYVGATEETKEFAAYKAAAEPTAKDVETVEFKDLAAGNLDLIGASDGDNNLGVARLDEVLTDIYNTERPELTYAGAFEGTKALKPIETGMNSIEETMNVQKVLRNGQVLILRDGKTYNMMGQIVE